MKLVDLVSLFVLVIYQADGHSIFRQGIVSVEDTKTTSKIGRSIDRDLEDILSAEGASRVISGTLSESASDVSVSFQADEERRIDNLSEIDDLRGGAADEDPSVDVSGESAEDELLTEEDELLALLHLYSTLDETERQKYRLTNGELLGESIWSKAINALMKMLSGGGESKGCRAHETCESCMAADCDAIELESVGTYIFKTLGVLDNDQLSKFLPKEIENNFVCGGYASYAATAKKAFDLAVKLHLIKIDNYKSMRINDCAAKTLFALAAPLILLIFYAF